MILMLRSLVLLVFIFSIWPASADRLQRELPDLLDLPAIVNPRSLHSLLLDITLAGNRLVAVGEKGHILYSDNQGTDWKQAQVPVQVTLTATHFPTPKLGWAVGHDGVILHSNDGGETWYKQLDGHQTGSLMALAAKNRVAQLAEAIAQGRENGRDINALVEARDNAEMALEEAQTEIADGPNRPFLDVWFHSDQVGYASGAFGYLFRTTDGGENWQDISLQINNPERLHLYSIQGWDDGTLMVVGEFGLAQRSEDAGDSWEVVNLGYEGTLFSVRRGLDPNGAFIVGLRSNSFYSDDRGRSWQPQALPQGPSLLGLDSSGNRAVMVGLAGIIVELRPDNTDYRYLSRGNRVNLSSVAVVDDRLMIAVGEVGVLRLSTNGEALSVTYLSKDSEFNKEKFPQIGVSTADSAIAHQNEKYTGEGV